MRNIAREKDISLQTLNKQAEKNPEIDKQVDQKVRDLGDSSEIVIDSRLGFYLIPDSFAVYLEVDLETAAERIFAERHKRAAASELASSSVEETKEKIIQRLISERQRYKRLYDTVHTNHRHYDLIVNTDKKDISEVVGAVISAYEDWQAGSLKEKGRPQEGVAVIGQRNISV